MNCEGVGTILDAKVNLVARKTISGLTIPKATHLTKKQQPVEKLRIIRYSDARLPAGNRLRCVQAEATNIAPRPHGLAPINRAMRMRAILDYRDLVCPCQVLDNVHLRRIAPDMDSANCLRPVIDS